jgi:hypothetical protein
LLYRVSDDPCGPTARVTRNQLGYPGRCNPRNVPTPQALWNRKAIILGRRLHIVQSFSQISRKLSGFNNPHRASPRGVEVLQPLNFRNCQPDQNVRAQSYRPPNRIYVQFPALTTNNDPTKWGIGRVNGHVPEDRSPPNLTDKYSTSAGRLKDRNKLSMNKREIFMFPNW